MHPWTEVDTQIINSGQINQEGILIYAEYR